VFSNNFFITITKNLNIQEIWKEDAVSILKIRLLGSSPANKYCQSLKLR
jgi:hypothetical protein